MLALLVALALLAVGLMHTVDVWSMSRQRERETELLFVGDQYRQAIQRYYTSAPRGGQRGYPPNLEVLLDDDRFPTPVHHLRRAYPDPITGKAEWGLLKAGDRIVGVYSLSEAAPLKKANFSPAHQAFKDAASYQDWVFAYVPRRGVVVPATPASAAPPATPPRKPPTSPRRSPS
ncbi:type II secretion system protein [Ramlibacter sp. G-1-2-2]|uniref:Type II secretion system protein n=1 Tax=Ramlibacter agri TaxID=2728837 RepID=A0A848H410_9BURK|nr:type II secretion system protein [Ramlibacter agri]